MTVNRELLRETMDYILAHPEHHKQTAWAFRPAPDCETSYCFAGAACILSGYEFDFAQADSLPGYIGGGEVTWFLTTGERIRDAARHRLGLDDVTAAWLFAANNDLAELKGYVDEICETGRIDAEQ